MTLDSVAIGDFLASLPDAALATTREGIVIAHNAMASHFFQVDLVGQNISLLLRAPAFVAALDKVAEGQEEADVDLEIRGSLNTHVRCYVRNLRGTDFVLILLRDFTREQAIEKMRSDFVANASHEMRTPLAAIIGSIETLQGPAKNDVKAREQFLDTMLTQAQRMKRLIDDLLALSRIELNEHVRPNAKVSLEDVSRQAISNLAVIARDAKVSIELKPHEKIEVEGDMDELLQVAQNLIENAVKYGSAGGRVEVDCYRHGGFGNLAIRDFGKGIPEIHLPRLTERFYRVSTQESRSRGGTGLGLAIVKHIVLRHRGKLAISSREGEGSTFTVSIPLYNSIS